MLDGLDVRFEALLLCGPAVGEEQHLSTLTERAVWCSHGVRAMGSLPPPVAGAVSNCRSLCTPLSEAAAPADRSRMTAMTRLRSQYLRDGCGEGLSSCCWSVEAALERDFQVLVQAVAEFPQPELDWVPVESLLGSQHV